MQLGLGFLDAGPGHGRITPCDIYQVALDGHLDPRIDPGSSLAIGAHRLMLSRGVYDDISMAPDSLIESRIEELALSLMAGSVELFNFFHTQVFPDFYQWPLDRRISLLAGLRSSSYDRKAVGQFCHPDGHYRSEHVQCITWGGGKQS